VSSAGLVSVVVPVRNEGRYVRRCLEAILAQDYGVERMEVLVVDGGSTDGTREIVGELASRHSCVRLIDNPAGRIPHGLNLGFRAASGRIVVRVDGHAVIDPDYVSPCVRTLEASGADNVGGPMRCRGLGFWGRAIALAMGSPFGRPAAFQQATEPREVESVHSGAFWRESIERVGLFDESIHWNEDYELNHRIRRTGGRIYFTPEIKWDYYSRESLPALARQFWNYGRGKAVVLIRRPGSLMARHLVAPLYVLSLIVTGVLAAGGRPLPGLGLLGLYVTATGFFSLQAARCSGISVAGAVALAFVCMHLSWGAGLLTGLLSHLARASFLRQPSTRRAAQS